jgi:hypothetical protein
MDGRGDRQGDVMSQLNLQFDIRDVARGQALPLGWRSDHADWRHTDYPGRLRPRGGRPLCGRPLSSSQNAIDAITSKEQL